MRRIYGIGEALLDIIFKDNQPVSATSGGSTLNTMVSLGRVGHRPSFLSKIGEDRVGKIILNFLSDNGVGTDFLSRESGYRSSLALAFLDGNNDAHFEIYKDGFSLAPGIEVPRFKPDDIVLFGSLFSLNPSIRPWLINILHAAREVGAIVIYDPNYRAAHACKVNQLRPLIEENLALATIVRGSNEDFHHIFNVTTIEEAAKQVKRFCTNVIITANAGGVYLFTPTLEKHFQVATLNPVSTIGAGDNFNAGLIHGIITNNIENLIINTMTTSQWQKVIEMATSFATEACLSLENYISWDFASKQGLK